MHLGDVTATSEHAASHPIPARRAASVIIRDYSRPALRYSVSRDDFWTIIIDVSERRLLLKAAIVTFIKGLNWLLRYHLDECPVGLWASQGRRRPDA